MFVLPETPDNLADKEEIDIRYYSIIYAAIDDLKDAMEGMLAPEMKEEVLGTAEVRELFKISKVRYHCRLYGNGRKNRKKCQNQDYS